MKIALLGINKTRKTGLETWKDNLIRFLSKKNKIREVYTSNIISILADIHFILSADITHSYSQTPGTILIILLRKILGKKHIHTVHGNYYYENKDKLGLKRVFWIPFNRLCVHSANQVTFPSNHLLQEIISKEKEVNLKYKVIPNGIDLTNIALVKRYSKSQLKIPEDYRFILEVTGFNLQEKAQGIDLLIKEFNELTAINKKNILYILGSGKLLQGYKNKYQSKNVKFLGFRDDALALIKSCDLLVHYSNLDSFGYVILEGLSFNKPVIAHGSRAFNEILGNGQISLRDINQSNLAILAKRSKKLIKKYSHLTMGESFLKLYKNETST
ncbi:glycosyltransferase family 4 protein [Candidatus Pacearchaeota archaeon]|nr:glycosyltransferase family 4 protein [Candidatus Pacearchaeota archaeon]